MDTVSAIDTCLMAEDHPFKVIYQFEYLKPFVRLLEDRTLEHFINQICDPNSPCSLPEDHTLRALRTAAEAHGSKMVPHVSQIVSTVIRIMSSGTESLNAVGCSKVICKLSHYVVDPLETEDEKSGIISSLCSPLSGFLMSTNESVSSGSALCITALIQSNSWQFASHDLITDICLKVSGALEEVHCQTISHLGLAVALLKHNRLTLEPYGRSLIRSGLSILDQSPKAGNSQMILSSIQMIHSIMKNLYLSIISSEISTITKTMEQLQHDSMPDIRSAACQVAETASKLCNQMLMLGSSSDDSCMLPDPHNKITQSSSGSPFKSSDTPCSSCSSGPQPKRRKLNCSEDVTVEHHALFRCSADTSDWTSFRDYAKNNKALVVKKSTPGSHPNHSSDTTSNELKLIIRRSYELLENFNECGLTFAGNLCSEYFVMDKYGSIKFDETAKEAVRKLEEEGVDEKDEDKHAFAHMIRREIFDMKPVPGDLSNWLFLVDGCDKKIDEMLKFNVNLMDEHQISSTFTSLFDTLLEKEVTDRSVYDAVITELAQKSVYSNWQLLVNCTTGNRYFRDTCKYRVKKRKSMYQNTPRGLLLMLRNSRQHSLKFRESDFARVVAEHFQDLISDFQIAMHKHNCHSQLNLKYSMG